MFYGWLLKYVYKLTSSDERKLKDQTCLRKVKSGVLHIKYVKVGAAKGEKNKCFSILTFTYDKYQCNNVTA